MITHSGRDIPVFPERWDPDDKEWIYFAWDDVLEGASISASTWTLPSGWTEHNTIQSQSVTTDAGDSYTAANGALVSADSSVSGVQVISNKVTLSDGRVYERSVRVIVSDI